MELSTIPVSEITIFVQTLFFLCVSITNNDTSLDFKLAAHRLCMHTALPWRNTALQFLENRVQLEHRYNGCATEIV